MNLQCFFSPRLKLLPVEAVKTLPRTEVVDVFLGRPLFSSFTIIHVLLGITLVIL